MASHPARVDRWAWQLATVSGRLAVDQMLDGLGGGEGCPFQEFLVGQGHDGMIDYCQAVTGVTAYSGHSPGLTDEGLGGQHRRGNTK